MPACSTFWRRRLEDCRFEGSLAYITRLCLKILNQHEQNILLVALTG